MGYVTFDQACDHIRIDNPDDETYLPARIEAASAMVANYLGASAPIIPEIATDDIAPEIKAATLLMAGYLYRYRDEDPGYTPGYLPAPVVSILYPLRNPSCA